MGDKNFGSLQKFRFPTIATFPTFWAGVKNLPNRPGTIFLDKKYRNTSKIINRHFFFDLSVRSLVMLSILAHDRFVSNRLHCQCVSPR